MGVPKSFSDWRMGKSFRTSSLSEDEVFAVFSDETVALEIKEGLFLPEVEREELAAERRAKEERHVVAFARVAAIFLIIRKKCDVFSSSK